MWIFFIETIPSWVSISIGILDLLVIISIVFLEKKNPRSIIIWILLFLVIPFSGFFLYLMFGNGPKINRKKWSKNKSINDSNIHNKMDYGAFKLYPSAKENNDIVKELIRLNEINHFPCTENNKVDFYVDAKSLYADMLKDISNAKKSINMMYYIFRNDRIGKEFIAAITKKAKEGIIVNLMYDAAANKRIDKRNFKELINAGGHVEAFFGTRLIILNLINSSYRNHRKITVIDGHISYVGGMNIGVEYLGEHKRITPWRDTSIRIDGDASAMLQMRYLQDLASNSNKIDSNTYSNLISLNKLFFSKIQLKNISPVQIISSGPDTPSTEIKYCYQKMINSATHDVYLETPYFIPDLSFYDSIMLAQQSGINVHLIIPGIYDHKMVYYVTLANLEPLLKAGAKVYLYNGFIHSKMCVSDDICASIGTANLDMRSFELNFEVNAILYGKAEVAKSLDIIKKDIENSKELTYEQFKNRSRFEKIKEGFFRIFSPLM